MFDKAKFLIFCVAALEGLLPVDNQPVSGQAIQLDVKPASGSGNQVGSHTVSCGLDASLTSMKKVTALTVYASRPYGREGEFDPCVSVDLWKSDPRVLSGIKTSDVDVHGQIGTGDNTKSQLVFSWKSPRNAQARQYKCVANGRDSSGRAVTISITSDVATPSESRSDVNIRDNLRLLTKTIVGGVANSTAEIEDSVQTVGANVEELQKNLDSLEELVKTQSSTIGSLQEHITSFTKLYKVTSRMSNFDVSEPYNGNVYYVSKVVAPLNIRAADALCALLDGYLVEIDDQDEFNFVLQFLKGVGGAQNFFTGINDIEEEGVFKFWHSKRSVSYLPWGPGEPSNSGNNEDCIEIRFGPNLYNDWVCNSSAKYVCEAPE